MEILYLFYKNVFSNHVPVCNKSTSNIYINLPKLSMDQRELYDGELTERKVKVK